MSGDAELLRGAAERAIRYRAGLAARNVRASEEALAALSGFEEPLPEGPQDPAGVVALLDDLGSPATTATAGPRFFGFVIGGSLHFSALAAARHDVLAAAGWDVDERGLAGAPPLTVIVGEEAHPSLHKALGLLGIGRQNVLRVPADGQGAMRADSLPAISGAAIVCLQAGNVNTGAFDPFAEVSAAAHAAGAWVHVDGAFGLWAAAAPARAHLVRGLGDADSWATDAHKWLNVPYDSGLAFVRHPEPLRAAMGVTAAYLPTSMMREPSAHAPELSRRARAVEVWAALRTLGRSGIADLVERDCRYAARFAEGLRHAGHEILNDVVLNQVLVKFGDEERTRRVIAAVQDEGTCWAGVTVWRGHTAMRISVTGWSTTADDVERSLAAMIRAAG